MEDRDLTLEECQKIQEALLSQDEYEKLSRLFMIMSNPTRLKIFSLLAVQELCVDDLYTILDMTQSAVSHQLAALRNANLVKARKAGKHVFYSLSDHHVMEIFTQALDHVRE